VLDAAIQQAVRDHSPKHSIVGGSLARVTPAGMAFEMHWGLADKEKRFVPNADTIYDWGSITKLLCGLTFMQQRDLGRVQLEDLVARHLPAFSKIPKSDGITIEHLLTHTSGLQTASTPEPIPNEAQYPLWPEIEAGFPRLKVEAPPGARYNYSNLGLMLVGRIVELLTRDEWESYAYKNWLMPLGMRDAYFDQTPLHFSNRRAESYTAEGKPYRMDVDHGATTSNGGLKASLRDMSRFAQFLLKGEPPLDEMMRPRFATGKGGHVGLAFHLEPVEGRTFIGHGGSAAGFRAWLYVDRPSKQAFILVVNTDTGKAFAPAILSAFAQACAA
jgi:CubicO group peptidase (beta-lactamase class C family)